MNSNRSKKKSFSFTGFLKLTRFPNLLIIGLTQYLCVIFLVAHPETWTTKLYDLNLLLLSSSTILIAAAGYIINDYYDIKIDYINKPDKVVVGKLIKRRIVLASHWLLNLAGIGIGFYLNLYIGILNLFAGFLLWLYSNQLKRLPFVGNLVIAFLTALSILVVAVYYHKNVSLLLCYAVFAFSINLIREIIKDMEDLRGDMRFGSKTLPIVWGLRKTKYFLYGLILIFVLIILYLTLQLENQTLNYFFIMLVVPIIYFIYLLYRADSQKRFHRLSTYCKLLMLAGISSIAFF
ncbi:MAG: geranylgeranylglycerol-phosphate geranylgeranyltransferase [Cyclobacteriaceae bacterium]|nr:geranylgeranylglycerol-phosphate geranylgeranyltransferase [Cyclobacteriaceae bacterium]